MDDYHQVIADTLAAHSDSLGRLVDYIEVGVLTGNSADAVLSTGKIRSSVLVDTFSDPTYSDFGSSADFVTKRLSKHNGLFKVIVGDSKQVLPTLTERFDVGFVDGDHTVPGCRKDITNMLHLLRDGGIMFVDDMQFSGIDELTRKFAADNHLQFAYHDVHNGLGELRKPTE